MQGSKLGEHTLAFLEQVHLDLPAVALAGAPSNESPCLATRNERHHTVGLRLQPLGELADMSVVAPAIPLDVEQHQILQRCNAVRSSRSLGKSLESPHLVAKLRQLFECSLGQYCIVKSDN